MDTELIIAIVGLSVFVLFVGSIMYLTYNVLKINIIIPTIIHDKNGFCDRKCTFLLKDTCTIFRQKLTEKDGQFLPCYNCRETMNK